jgi:uncharacterized membrane protein
LEIFQDYGLEFVARYGHVISGITWIGLLYYFNFVQTPAFAAFEAGPRNEAVSKLVPRALWWFRYGALMTLLFGLWLFVQQEQYEGDYMKTLPGMTIASGILFAVIMFANVWFVIWPAQKRVIANADNVLAGREADAGLAPIARRAATASRTNTFLSIPMLFFMIATSHFAPFFDNGVAPESGDRAVWWIVILVVAVVTEAIALMAPAAGSPQTWHLDQHRNTIIGGFVLTILLYLLMEILFG